MRVDRRLVLAAAAACGCVFVAPAMAQSSMQASPIPIVQRQLRFTMSLSNPLAEELLDQAVWAYLPASETPTQRLVGVQVSVPHQVLSDSLGHRIVKVQLASLPALSTRVVTIVADLEMRAEPVPGRAAGSQVSWLDAERYIESTDPGIRSLAAQLRRGSDLDTARAIYDWVRTNLHYAGYVADDLGALHALKERSGDCTEYAYLAVALARANGIPARMVGGYVADRNMAPRSEEYHNWAELFLEGAWRMVDAQKEAWLAPAAQYVAFRYYLDKDVNPVGLAHRFRVQGRMQVRL